MGVSGFTTYIDNNNYLLSNYKLKDTKVVIDGNNFYHFIYYHFLVPHVYGGDYKQFAKICHSFFESLSACNVIPYVVFDGAYDLTGVKFKSAITRVSKKILAANSVAHGESYRVLPLLTHEVFIQVLNNLNIPHATCNFEADSHTASLAAYYNCPVLTNDSDFFVSDLPGGVILLDYFDVVVRRDEDGSRYMKAQLFRVQKLVDHMKLPNADFVALFATVLGNDIVDKTVFEAFLTRFIFVKLNNNKKRLGRLFSKITGLFKWLSSKKSIEGAVNDLISECALEKREKIRALVRSSLVSYSITHTYLIDFFETYHTDLKSYFNNEEGMVNHCNEKCPKWLQSSLNRGNVSSRVINLWVSGKLILQPQIGSHSQESSHIACRDIRRLMQVLVTNGGRKEFREYVKKDGKLNKQLVNSDFNFKTYKNTLCCENIIELNKKDALEVYLEAFEKDLNGFLSFPENYKFILSVIFYWVSVSQPSKTCVWSLLLAVFAPEVMVRMVPFKVVRSEELETLVSNHLFSIKHRRKYFNIHAIHSFTQFQSCLQSLHDLNSFLNHPLHPFDLSTSFNSSCLLFIHHFLSDNLNNLDEYVHEIFSKLPHDQHEVVVEVYNKLSLGTYLRQSTNKILNNKTGTSKKVNRKTKIVLTKCSAEEVYNGDEDLNEGFFDEENIFSCLSLKISE